MPRPVDRTAFLANPTRFKIAEFCNQSERSLEEIAERLGRASGSLSQPTTMRKKKALLTKARRGADGRGGKRVFRLNPDWRSALAEARDRQCPDLPVAGQELLLVPLADTPAACEAIAAGIEGIEWAARLTGEWAGLLVATVADSSGETTVRVVKALGSAGRQARRLHLEEVMSPARLRDWSRAISVSSSTRLPPGR